MIAMQILKFKLDFYSGVLLMKLFNSSRKFVQVKIITVKLKPCLLSNTSLHVCSFTFITEALLPVATARQSPFMASMVSTLSSLSCFHNTLCY